MNVYHIKQGSSTFLGSGPLNIFKKPHRGLHLGCYYTITSFKKLVNGLKTIDYIMCIENTKWKIIYSFAFLILPGVDYYSSPCN